MTASALAGHVALVRQQQRVLKAVELGATVGVGAGALGIADSIPGRVAVEGGDSPGR